MLQWITNTGKHLIIVVNFILIVAFGSRFYFDKVLADLNESLKIKNEILKQNLAFENTYKKIQQKIANVKIYTLSELSLPYLSEIVNSVPNGTSLSGFDYSGRRISFSAIIPSKESLQQVIINLKSLKFVKNISVPNIGKKSGNDQEIKADFILDLT